MFSNSGPFSADSNGSWGTVWGTTVRNSFRTTAVIPEQKGLDPLKERENDLATTVFQTAGPARLNGA